MKLFLDTANLEDIRAAARLGVIHGVTTNPTLISREKGDFSAIIREIASLVDGPVFAEVLSSGAEGMIREGRELAGVDPAVCVKIPMTEEGLAATSVLSKEGIRVCCTLVFSAAQALLAANAGARYVAPFIGRFDDIGYDGIEAVASIAEVLSDGDFETEVIAASVRSPHRGGPLRRGFRDRGHRRLRPFPPPRGGSGEGWSVYRYGSAERPVPDGASSPDRRGSGEVHEGLGRIRPGAVRPCRTISWICGRSSVTGPFCRWARR